MVMSIVCRECRDYVVAPKGEHICRRCKGREGSDPSPKRSDEGWLLVWVAVAVSVYAMYWLVS